MSANVAFTKLKEYIENRPAAIQSLSNLREGVEIGVIIAHSVECAVFRTKETPQVQRRPAQKPDVVFYVEPAAIDILTQNPGEDIGELGVDVLKQYLAGTIKIQVTGSVLNLMRNGYLEIMRAGGERFMGFIARHGVSSLSKIPKVIQKLRRR